MRIRSRKNLTATQQLSRRRRGIIFITALGILVILGGLVISFAQQMRVEGIASANRTSAAQADTIELGAEQWVLANVEGFAGDSVSLTQLAAEGLPVGNGFFWLIRPNFEDNTLRDYGLVDEASKLNINKAAAARLLLLPDMTQEIADAMLDWRKDASQATGDGAESDYYNGLPEPYDAKNAPYETVEELSLVKGFKPFNDGNDDGNIALFGYDLNRDGVISPEEQAVQGGGVSLDYSSDDTRGLFPYLTIYSSSSGTGGKATTGLINVFTAPAAVLATVPGIDISTAESIVATREQASLTYTDTSWYTGPVRLTPAPAGGGGRGGPPAPTPTTYFLPNGLSNQYSADIVAVSGDGRAFKRVRIVVDATTPPAKILYRKDMTSYGWPLPQEIQDALRSGRGITPNQPGVGVVAQN